MRFLMSCWDCLQLRPQLDLPITFDGNVLRCWFFCRWKTLTLSFPSANESASADITMKSCDRIESVSQYQEILQNYKNLIPIPGYGYEFCHIFVNSYNVLKSRYRFDSVTTFGGDVLRRWFFRRWKAESRGFPSAKESASEDITIKSYGQIELVP